MLKLMRKKICLNKEDPAGTGRKKKTLSPAEYAVTLLARRSYSVEGLRRKLLEKEYEESLVSEVVDRFIRQGFLNDFLFAESLAGSMNSSGYGKKRIIAKLREKKVSAEIIQKVLEETGENLFEENRIFSEDDSPYFSSSGREAAAAEKALKGKMRTLKNEKDFRKRKEKALRFLSGRGFGAGICYQVVEKYLKAEEEAHSFS